MLSRNPRSVSLMSSMCSISMNISSVVCEAHFHSFPNWMNAFWASWHSFGPRRARAVWAVFKSHSQFSPVFYVEVYCLTGTLCSSSHQQSAPQTDSTAASWILQINVIWQLNSFWACVRPLSAFKTSSASWSGHYSNRAPVRGDEVLRSSTGEILLPEQPRALDDAEQLHQQVWALLGEVVLVGQAGEEVTGRLHRGRVAAQDVGAEKDQSSHLILPQGLAYLQEAPLEVHVAPRPVIKSTVIRFDFIDWTHRWFSDDNNAGGRFSFAPSFRLMRVKARDSSRHTLSQKCNVHLKLLVPRFWSANANFYLFGQKFSACLGERSPPDLF